jgi:hypothetical protein
MKHITLDSEAETTLQKIISLWPTIMQAQRKDKILHILSLIMDSRKIETATKKLVIEATKLVIFKSYDLFFT